jgi:hypothetical protein
MRAGKSRLFQASLRQANGPSPFQPIAMIAAQCDRFTMPLLLGLLMMGAVDSAATAAATPNIYDYELTVVVRLYSGRCTYWMSDDAYHVKASRLAKYLGKYPYPRDRGLKLIVFPETPPKCIARARKAGRRAGFIELRERLLTPEEARW